MTNAQKTAEAKQPRLKIGDFRRQVDALNFSRSWVTGGTSCEFKKQNIPQHLEPKIQALQDSLQRLPSRFTDDAALARSAIEYAEKTITRWHSVQG